MRPDIEFRAARASDVDRALPLLYSAGPAAYDYLFTTAKSDAHTVLGHLFERDAGFFGYRVFTTAVVEGRVVGVGSFYSGVEMPLLTVRAFAHLFAYYGPMGGVRALQRILSFAGLTPAPSRGTVLITNLGVAPEMHGKGIASALLQHEIERARKNGKQKMALDVALDNPGAERLYTRLGFRTIKERRPEGDMVSRVPGLRRMIYPL
jgi:ribosomal protein S18 acetylase RimI-like enzyme